MYDANNISSDLSCHYQSLNDETFRRDRKYGACPLCLRRQRPFYCTECVRTGNFTHSKTKSLERFADKKMKMYKIREENRKLLQSYEESLSSKIKAEDTKREIFLCSERIRLRKECIKYSQEELSKGGKRIKEIQSEIELVRSTNTSCTDKIKRMKKDVGDKLHKIQSQKQILKSTYQSLKTVIRKSVQELVRCIFPITEIKSGRRESKFSINEFSELKDALQMIQQTGQQVVTGSYYDLDYAINEPRIPGNGDYSAYSVWVLQHEDNLPSMDSNICQRKFAIDISAALCFTAHLVRVLTHYLDIHVPNRLCYSEFCGHELKEHQFLHKVAKLNANIVHLCLSQKVDPCLIYPYHTIRNLLLLLDPKTSDLGRVGPINVNSDFMQQLEDRLSQNFLPLEENKNGGDGDDTDLSSFELVDLTNTAFSDDMHATTEEQSQASANYQPVTSLAGELISSVALMWRAATGHK